MSVGEPGEALIPVCCRSTTNTEDREKGEERNNHTKKNRERFTWFTTKGYVHRQRRGGDFNMLQDVTRVRGEIGGAAVTSPFKLQWNEQLTKS